MNFIYHSVLPTNTFRGYYVIMVCYHGNGGTRLEPIFIIRNVIYIAYKYLYMSITHKLLQYNIYYI
jgi:hypothetical protein